MLEHDAKTSKTVSRPEQLMLIQYLRAIAALMVVLHHARNDQSWLFNPMLGTRFGAAGVDIFFVISGFIMFTAARHEAPLDFVKRRIIRVAPLYWAATAAFLVFAFLVTPAAITGLDVVDIVKSALFIPFENPAYPGFIYPALVPGWTLNYEMFFYAIFALAIAFGRPVFITAAIIMSTVLVGMMLSPTTTLLKFYTDPILLEFLAGVIIGWIVGRIDPSRAWPLLPIGAALLVFLASPFFDDHQQAFIRLIPAAMIVLGAVALERRRKFVTAPLLKLLGDASYSIYLSHPITLVFVDFAWKRMPLDGWLQFIGVVISALIASAVVGVVVHLVVERPTLRCLNAALRRKATATSASPVI